MYDQERVARLISDIHRYLQDIPRLSIGSREDLADPKNFYALSMLFFSLLNAVIDLAEEVVAAEDLGMPGTYRENFFLLAQNQVIGQQIYEQMSSFVSYRNRLAHAYGTITPDDLINLLSRVDRIRDFVAVVRERVTKS